MKLARCVLCRSLKNYSLVFASLWFLTKGLNAQAQKPASKSQIEHVLILGNSITSHAPSPNIGWYGNWGMAASAQNRDFVHLLEKKMNDRNPSLKVSYGNIANSFERRFSKMDTVSLKKYAQRPDLLLIKIGENINDRLAARDSLHLYLIKLVSFLSGKNTHIVVVGSFWPNQNTNRIMQKTCVKHNWTYISLDGLYTDRSVNTAINSYANAGVAKHPSDTGMEKITERIWEGIQFLFE